MPTEIDLVCEQGNHANSPSSAHLKKVEIVVMSLRNLLLSGVSTSRRGDTCQEELSE
jgi:hypothetical protein